MKMGKLDKTINSKALSNRLRNLLIEKDMTQLELAEKVGISQAAMSKIVKGITQRPKQLLEIAQALGVNQNWLMTGNDSLEVCAEAVERHGDCPDLDLAALQFALEKYEAVRKSDDSIVLTDHVFAARIFSKFYTAYFDEEIKSIPPGVLFKLLR